jgi:HPt (histidine-containing phosphotransfer) domain-containing protein
MKALTNENSSMVSPQEHASRAAADAANAGGIFLSRLESERVHLVSLRAALERATERTGIIFDDLQFRAHNLNGVAGTLEASDVAKAAHQLEDAAFAASRTHSNSADIPVRAALDGLIRLLGQFDAGESTSMTSEPGIRIISR